jgi:hypothetical protein
LENKKPEEEEEEEEEANGNCSFLEDPASISMRFCGRSRSIAVIKNSFSSLRNTTTTTSYCRGVCPAWTRVFLPPPPRKGKFLGEAGKTTTSKWEEEEEEEMGEKKEL